MVATGVCLGCAMSSKWVGLFIVLSVGLHTIWHLWVLLGDLTLSIVVSYMIYSDADQQQKQLLVHFLARVFGLILVPLLVYLFWFYVHFRYRFSV